MLCTIFRRTLSEELLHEGKDQHVFSSKRFLIICPSEIWGNKHIWFISIHDHKHWIQPLLSVGVWVTQFQLFLPLYSHTPSPSIVWLFVYSDMQTGILIRLIIDGCYFLLTSAQTVIVMFLPSVFTRRRSVTVWPARLILHCIAFPLTKSLSWLPSNYKFVVVNYRRHLRFQSGVYLIQILLDGMHEVVAYFNGHIGWQLQKDRSLYTINIHMHQK